ncbi:2Fe-2S iron-sulfur cluster binding domain-containing protein [Myxococcus llanfairpwllgwyngyllgogerychwyrndrobwllllantysiliogogogochensis]|uniref:2Fe-2S iron-sulfur cluster binding domain-containing protein n=1 Tax=Myxococcus llanfairpwllgwyngyllgogerychwyrndrobwllllantysiliogogogochensis TaxID=2590453 RepID=A0A540X010_9BACT|nr:2Fe-2S iron-sulfur cluster-binding protein [Myxococcus llanfairpwllgwyngyllgogerychwyrndrobwllllantysiliogogogochensis]NTX32999.1 2Fe-2S iron-sulfur cluster binding domain-containing protein [Myxococcus sp. CA033]NTX53452.1 2Fe-2S iron-sulfur cluster binding domain-containing protein [Myxococcus sp. CA039A]TQF14074.1 2Fe-2S iron-sulfur cluster binding domain-containing protein [Myxococcus llanfairpwllgwyngyllgogerychwyrndrobwllllantysiliogogogochensis]
MPKVIFKSPLAEVSVDVPPGTILLDAAEQGGAQVGHSCGGVCGCSTCHIWVRKGLDSLSEQSDAEADRLDMGFDVRPYSRLSCQTEVSQEDVTVEITEESLTAFMDENPVIRRALEAEGKWPLKK